MAVGPFEWTPSTQRLRSRLHADGRLDATGDPSNIDNSYAGETIAEWRLVPNDNNIGQRNVFPVVGGGGLQGLFSALQDRFFVVGNPFREQARVELKTKLPSVLEKAGWALNFSDLSGSTFVLRPGTKRVVHLSVQPGQEFLAADVRGSADRDIVVEVHANDILIGGMMYRLDPDLTRPANQGGDKSPDRCRHQAKDLLRCLQLEAGPVKRVRVRKVSNRYELGDC